MDLRTVAVLVLAVTCCSAQGDREQQCKEAELDPFEMAEMNIFPTANLSPDIDENMVQKQVTLGLEEGGEDLKSIAKNVAEFQKDVEEGNTDIDAQVGDPKSATNQLISQYKWSCPKVWKFVNNLAWYFQSEGRYCWSYYPVAVAVCPLRYCALSQVFHPVFSVYYRCFPEYRTIWLYSRCVEKTTTGLVWSSRFVRHVVSRGCACRRFYKFYIKAADTCELDEEQ